VRSSGLALAFVTALAPAALVACASGPRQPSHVASPASAPAGPAEVLERFTTALTAQRWPEAYALLSDRWRARYTPSRLASDWAAAGSVSREAAERAHALLAAGQRPTIRARGATLTVGAGRAAVLVEEEGGWRVDALE
jgi:hypothetical protein